jgi:hypothetical protein
MRWHPLEVDILRGLEDLARGAGPRHLVGPPGAEGETEILALVLREARAFLEVEADVARRRVETLEKAATRNAGGTEHDRTGRAFPRSLPGHGETLERLAAARRAVEEHGSRLAALGAPDVEARALETIRRFTLRPRRDLEALRASPEDGDLVEVHADGYALVPDAKARLVARREHLGLPPGRDWT